MANVSPSETARRSPLPEAGVEHAANSSGSRPATAAAWGRDMGMGASLAGERPILSRLALSADERAAYSAVVLVAARCEPVGQSRRLGQPVLAGEAHRQVGHGGHRDAVTGRDDQRLAVDLAAQDPAHLRSLLAQWRVGAAHLV